MQVKQLREELQDHILLMDGAMGTYFNHCHPGEGEAELANEKHPEWIKAIHEKYIDAGARIIRTNTFAVNHLLFAAEEIPAAIAAAVKNAKMAVENRSQDVYIAGSVGPIRMEPETGQEEYFLEYQTICDALYANGIRIFVLETFGEAELAEKIAAYIKDCSVKDGKTEQDVFVQVQYTINRMGYTLYGQSAARVLQSAEESTVVDGVGFNCGIGAAHMAKQLEKLTFSKHIILSALPNAGYEQGLQGRQFLLDNPEYYAKTMEQVLAQGVNVIGGCCGTTPSHIRALAAVVKENMHPVPKKEAVLETVQKEHAKENVFIAKLNRGEKVYVVEIDSPFHADAEKFRNAALQLKENQVDLVTISDSPMARPRAEAFLMGSYIAKEAGVRVMPHVSCRDRNIIGLRSAILGAHINGIRDMLIITGDPVGRDDRGRITGVFDFHSIRLMEYVKNMNEEVFSEEPFFYGGALNYAGVNVDAIVNRMQKKMDAGCSYFLTQPVYADTDIARVRELKERTGAKILLGLMPLVSYKNALFMKNEMPGIDVPDEVLACYRPDMTREEAEETAIRVCVSIGQKARDFADGYYFMTPFNRVGLINRIMNRLREEDA